MLLFLTSCYILIFDTYITNAYIYLIIYFQNLRIRELKSNLLKLLNSERSAHYLKTIKLLVKHNRICAQIETYNKFWENYFLRLILTLIPINLLCLTQLVYMKNNDYYIYYYYGFIVFITWLFVFFLFYCASTMSKAIHSTWNPLFFLQLKTKHAKFKILNTFERMVNTRLTVGFTAKNLFMMTHPMLYKVIMIIHYSDSKLIPLFFI